MKIRPAGLVRDLYVNDPVGLFGERELRQFLRVQRIAVNVPDCLALRLADEIQGIAVQGRIEHMNLLNSGNCHILHLLRGDVQTFECTLSTDHLWLCCHQNGIFIQPSGQTDFKILRKNRGVTFSNVASIKEIVLGRICVSAATRCVRISASEQVRIKNSSA